MAEYILKLKTGEQQVYDFLKKFAFNVDIKDFSFALRNTRKTVKQNGPYIKGLFFKSLLANVEREVDWKLAEDLENEFVRYLK